MLTGSDNYILSLVKNDNKEGLKYEISLIEL
jgi:hypothetical protein